MIAMHATHEHPATSLSRFFDAHRAAYRRMLATGDIADAPPRSQIDRGRTKAQHRAIVDREVTSAIARIRAGDTLTDVAHDIGISPKTLQSRLSKRGLSVGKIQNPR